jgi:hypothetical protein
MTPAEELRAAATMLREAAADSDSENWYNAESLALSLDGADVAWIALAHPGLAEPLAAWLDDAAWTWDVVRLAERRHLLAVARVINGGAS